MQEEIEHKTVNLAISTTKLSARTLLRGMQFLLRQYDKHASQGKQSMKRLVRQNRRVTNVEIPKTRIKDFDSYKHSFHVHPYWFQVHHLLLRPLRFRTLYAHYQIGTAAPAG